ncbi:GrpB family protein [Nocardiopsis sp. LOL_012]|uniref:GrpB family protein n=1 Tax=Nocardiopsis sp. LOL_012 TaxID=3345409 RepID=UPI003A88F6E5
MPPLETSPLPFRGRAEAARHRDLPPGPVLISPYDPKWPLLSTRQKAKVREALGERALLIEHVGSTAVPGLAARPCVDLLLAVADPDDEPAYLPDLEHAGYRVAADRDGPFGHRVLEGLDVNLNLHVLGEGDPEIERILAFRDRLAADEDTRERYRALKDGLAERTWERVDDYIRAKSAFVDAVLAETGAPQRSPS